MKILAFSFQIVAAPLAAGVLSVDPPGQFSKSEKTEVCYSWYNFYIPSVLFFCFSKIDFPESFGFLMAYYLMAETWFAILFTVLVEIVPAEVRSVCIAIFLFLMNNIGGNLPVIVEPLANLFDLRVALYIIWAGFVAASKFF